MMDSWTVDRQLQLTGRHQFDGASHRSIKRVGAHAQMIVGRVLFLGVRESVR
jgi:hypothetical protein